jgi:hypothetical protein
MQNIRGSELPEMGIKGTPSSLQPLFVGYANTLLMGDD